MFLTPSHSPHPPSPLSSTPQPKSSLPFGPLLSVQECTLCRQPAAFFFDRNRYERAKDRHRTTFLEYFLGHPGEHRNWEETQKLATWLPPTFEWQRTSYDSAEVVEGVRLVFRDFDSEYLRPDYLMDALWHIVDNQPKGYIHVMGPAGIGKTYYVRGLERAGSDRGVPVLGYYILPGTLTDYRTFISELADRARDVLRFRTQEIQSKVATVAELQAQFVEFIGEIKRANHLDTLVIALDALDELPEPAPNAATLTGFLPLPDQLPDGCFVLLTSRETLRPTIRTHLDRLRAHPTTTQMEVGSTRLFTHLHISPTAPTNQDLLRAYLHTRLPEAFRTPAHLETVLQRSGGVFLYAFHLCRALEAGVFPHVADLPESSQFYPAYLSHLRERVGEVLYGNIYLPTLLLLAAVQQPVTLTQLSSWGLSPDKLRFALLDLHDFLRVHRVRCWHDSLSDTDSENRYEIAHEAFVRFIRDDPQLSGQWREKHGVIAHQALTTHAGRWDDIDPNDDAALYDLRFIFAHLHEAGLHDAEAALLNDEQYAWTCGYLGRIAYEKSRYHLAIDFLNSALTVFEHLVYVKKRQEFANDLARALVGKGAALRSLGQLHEAIDSYDTAIAIYQQLVEGGRSELANDLAAALMNKGLALAQMEKWQDATACYDKGILLWQRLLEAGMTHLAPELIKGLGIRFSLSQRLHEWDVAAADVVSALTTAMPLLQAETPPESLVQEISTFLEELRALSQVDRTYLYTALGEWAGVVQRLIEEQGE